MNRATAAISLLAVVGTALAQEADLRSGLAKCAVVSDSLQRLVCYDALAKAAGPATVGPSSPLLPIAGLQADQPSSTPQPTTLRSTARQGCAATTKKGARCSRLAESGGSYCWQHKR